MGKVIAEDALRNDFKRIPKVEECAWRDGHLSECIAHCSMCHGFWLSTPPSSRCTARRRGLISSNLNNPGRPSHSYQTYLMASLRLMMGAAVHAGNEHTS